MKKTNKFSPEVRERAVRMVQEHHAHILTQGSRLSETLRQQVESPRVSRRLNTLRGLSHEEDKQVLTRGA